MLGCGGGGELSGGDVGDGVGYLLDYAAVAGEADGDLHSVVEVHRAFIGDGDTGHRGEDAERFDFVIAEAQALHECDAGLLHPSDVVGVVDYAHLVGFVILCFACVGEHGFSDQM